MISPSRVISLYVSAMAFACMIAGSASAQTTINPTTTTTQFAGRPPGSTTVGDVTAPQSGLILSGSATNPATGKPYRHVWYGDAANGFCRLDPDVDTPGTHQINTNTCTGFVNSVQFKPGQAAFDPATNNIYVPDIQANSVGVFRLHFLPTGDSGQGMIDPINMEVLAGSGTNTKQDPGGCPMPGNPTLGGTPQAKVPDSAALGPDNNLWIAFKQSGAILRINNPSQPVPSGTACQSFLQVVGTTPDNKKNFGLAWIGHDLYGGDGFSTWVMHNADTNCLTPQTGNKLCTGSLGPSNILSTQTPSPTATASDQFYPSLTGNNLYVANTASVIWVGDITNPPSETIATNYGGSGFQFTSGLMVDNSNPAAEVLYVGDDPSNGLSTGQGRWWTVAQAPPAPAPPGTPTNVTASAGDSQATVSWTPAQDGQPVNNYIVHNSFSSNGTTVADVIVNPNSGTTVVPTSTTVTGLTNGVTYQFEVAAQNSLGTSAFSSPSNSVTPQALTVPAAPTNVQATAGNAMASVVWTAPTNNGGTAITGYTVTALVNGAASGITATAAANATGVNVSGLTNGTTYTFTVHATNSVGNSAESIPSNAVTPTLPAGPPAMTISMTGPSSVNANSFVTYTITATNNGPPAAADVIVTDTLPSNATFQSDTTSQGICSLSGSTLTCTLGGMNAGTSATINVTVQIGTTSITNTASLQATDSSGAVVATAGPASATTTIATPTTTTDLQVTGSAKNGGPANGSADTYTWQVKNNGPNVANAVQFSNTLPASLTFESASASTGSCSGPAPGTAGGTITCSTTSLAKGATMTVTVNVIVNQVGSIATTGSASFSGTDTNTANNSFTVTINAK